MDWVNDGTSNGTIYFYLDGVQQGQYTLGTQGQLWKNGIYILQYDTYCYYGGILGGGACTGNGTEPLDIDYIRVWQAE
jgi:hypothetical protein